MLKIILGRGEDKRIRHGHPWVFSNEIREVSGKQIPGETAEVFSAGGDYLGTGYHNGHSLIAVRILSRRRDDIDTLSFYHERIMCAYRSRQQDLPGCSAFRVVFGEGDFLPGLVLDKYGDYLVAQFLTAGMERRRDLILKALLHIFRPVGIVARNDVAVRHLEGLEEKVELLYGSVPERVEMEEHGLRLWADLRAGQKTGQFLDQQQNHLLLRKIAPGADMLDCFSYSGSWGLNAAAFGARSVLGIDISERAVVLARENAALNGLTQQVTFETADAFACLRELKGAGRRFDIIVLDPPAFVKNRKGLAEALKGYLTINRRGMELLKPGGYLITCSCSYHLGREQFREMLQSAAFHAGRSMRLVAVCAQPPDHPVLLAVPETEYLKCFLLQAVDDGRDTTPLIAGR